MLEAVYIKNGVAISDFDVREWAKSLIDAIQDKEVHSIYISSGIAISAVRELVSTGKVPFENVWFVFGDKKIQINEYAMIHEWPRGFADLQGEMAENIIRNAMNKRRNKNE